MAQSESEPGSRSEKAENSDWECPECGDRVDPRGAVGHMTFKHDLGSDEAKQIYADSKNSSSNRVGGGGSEAASPDPTLPSDNAPIYSGDDRVVDSPSLEEKKKRVREKELENEELKQDIRRQNLEENLGGEGSGGEDLLDKMMKLDEAGLIDLGGDDMDAAEELKQQLARLEGRIENQSQQPVADGSGSLVDRAVSQGVSDPDTLRELAELDPQKEKINRRYDFLEESVDRIGRAVSRLPEGVISSMVGGVLQQATEQSAQPREREPGTTEVRENPDRETVEEASSPHAEEMSAEGGGSNE